MKKIYALMLATVLTLSFSVPVCANVVSPIATPEAGEPGTESPKTGDLSLLCMGLAGVSFAGTAVVAGFKSKK